MTDYMIKTGKYLYLILIGVFLFNEASIAQESSIISIWEGKPLFDLSMKDIQKAEVGTDGVTRYYDITLPTLDYYKAEKPNGSAVIICPGGGYERLAYTHEGEDMAKWFNQRGISAFILKYRIPNDKYMEHKEEVPLADAQQAIYFIRKHAADFDINVNEVGIMGFSAGGHVASALSTHFDKSIIPNKEKINLRPDFSILVYPVITMNKEFTHMGFDTFSQNEIELAAERILQPVVQVCFTMGKKIMDAEGKRGHPWPGLPENPRLDAE